jgi:hypothetical protein
LQEAGQAPPGGRCSDLLGANTPEKLNVPSRNNMESFVTFKMNLLHQIIAVFFQPSNQHRIVISRNYLVFLDFFVTFVARVATSLSKTPSQFSKESGEFAPLLGSNSSSFPKRPKLNSSRPVRSPGTKKSLVYFAITNGHARWHLTLELTGAKRLARFLPARVKTKCKKRDRRCPAASAAIC